MTFIGRDLVSNVARGISRELNGVSGTAARVGSGFSSSMSRAGSAVLGLTSLVAGLSLGVGAGMLYASGKAAAFDQTVQLLVNHANLAQSEIGAMEAGLMSLAQTTGYSAQELATSVFWLESVKTKSETVAQTLEKQQLAAQLARVSNADLSSATKALVTVWTSGTAGGLTFAQMTGQLNAVVSEGVMKLDDLTSSLKGGLGPVLKTLNIPLDQAGAALDMMTRATGNANSGATGLRNSLIFLSGGSKAGNDAMKELGLNAATIKKELGTGQLVTAFQQIGAAINKLPDGAEKMKILTMLFSRTRGAAAGAALIQDLQTFGDLVGVIDEKGKDFQKDWNSYAASPAQNIHVLQSNWQNFVVAVGMGFNTAILPALTNLSGSLSGVASWMMSHQADMTGFFNGIGSAANSVIHWVGDEWPKITPVLKKFGDILTNVYNSVLVPLGGWLIGTGVPWFVNFMKAVLNMADAVLSPLMGAFKAIVGFLSSNSGVVKVFADIIAGMFIVKKVEDWAGAISGKGISAVKSLTSLLTLGKYGGGSSGGGSGIPSIASSIAQMSVANMSVAVMEGGVGMPGGGLPGIAGKGSGIVDQYGRPIASAAAGEGAAVAEGAGGAALLGGLTVGTAAMAALAPLVIASMINPDVPGKFMSGFGVIGNIATGKSGAISTSDSGAIGAPSDFGAASANANALMQGFGANKNTGWLSGGSNDTIDAMAKQYNKLGDTSKIVYAELASSNQEAAVQFATWIQNGYSVQQALNGIAEKYPKIGTQVRAINNQVDTWADHSIATSDKVFDQSKSDAEKFRDAWVASYKGTREAGVAEWMSLYPDQAQYIQMAQTGAALWGKSYADLYKNGKITAQGIQTDLGIITTAANATTAQVDAINWAIKNIGLEKPIHITVTGPPGNQSIGFRQFALGGYNPGGPMIVGEQGAELWMPGRSGSVVPHSVLQSAMRTAQSAVGAKGSDQELCNLLTELVNIQKEILHHSEAPRLANSQVAGAPGVQAQLYNAITETIAARRRGARGF